MAPLARLLAPLCLVGALIAALGLPQSAAAQGIGIGGSGGGVTDGPVPCDAAPGSIFVERVWRTRQGEDLAPSLRYRPAFRGETVVLGMTFRNCAAEATLRNVTITFGQLKLELQDLGRAFRYRGVQAGAGLGAPTVRGDRLSWGARTLTVAPGTQQTLAVRLESMRPGTFRVRSSELASLDGGPFQPLTTVLRGSVQIVRARLVGGAGLGGLTGDCARPYHVLGLRGSGEGRTPPYGMAGTVGKLARNAVGTLGQARVRTLSIPYDATPVEVIAEGNLGAFLNSMYQGQRLLANEIRRVVARCKQARIAVVGYSQGAGAAGEALRTLAPRELAHVRVAVLIADPHSRSGGGDDVVVNPLLPSDPGVRVGEGILGGRAAALPPDRLFDVCFVSDIVCDARPGLAAKLPQAVLAPIHSEYKSCCTGVPLARVLGRVIARRLRQ